ncbi:MAG: SUMF1/EgtB/PvdO family nonheme iron enzyme [Alphaproteobacteria bacterium]|nr:SUMF1/EgtB/PvdO family nonheme iron enzyme [Alphaproteobacteria bacterium]
MSDFEGLLEQLVPGAGRVEARSDLDAPDFPRGLGLEPRALLARGGQGWVFRAHDPVLQRDVAVKIVRADAQGDAEQALLEEARRTASLDHPSVLPVHRVVVADGRVCVEYRLAPQSTLEALLADPALLASRDVPGRLVLLRGPVRALRRAHALGVVHGDLHPGNLLLGEDDEVYVLDWSGRGGAAGVFAGSPGHAAPEVLAGAPHSPAGDIYALGAVAWELCTGRPLRPRMRDEELGAFVARWRDRPTPALPADVVLPAGVPELLASALADAPARRCDAAAFADLLDDALSGASERAVRLERGEALLAQARETLGRYRELGKRLEDERTVVASQRARVPGHAPPAAKKALWAAEDRLVDIEGERALVWLDAMQQAVLGGAFCDDDAEARDMVAELWWVRLEDQSARGQAREVMLAAHQVQAVDPDRRGATLQAACRLSLDIAGDRPARVEIARLVPHERRLVPRPVATVAAPLPEHRLPPGRYQLTVHVDRCAPLSLPLALDRAEHHRAVVDPRPVSAIGDGFVLCPGGAFLLGGDPDARDPLPRCRPTLPDLFVQRDPVTVAAWAAFLADLPPERAVALAPGSRGPLGPDQCWWPLQDGHPAPPAGWDPAWPVVGIDADAAAAYAAWSSERLGRSLRLPAEEEWERAARGCDGRAFPWGDAFDPTFAHMRASRVGPPGLSAVGAFPVDTSPFGVRGMAGGVREWTASLLDSGEVVVRGGGWQDEAHDLRCASRRGLPGSWRSASVGFRLVSEEEAPG